MSEEDIDTDGSLTVDDVNPELDNVSLNSFSTYCTPDPPSILSYQFENGRRYQTLRESAYLMPNDEREQERLEILHVIFKLAVHGALNLAPLPSSIHRALDFATGTGNWAIEFADLHPGCEVVGTDLSLIQPMDTPPNCHFIVDDVRPPWIFEKKFDYIHGRSIKGIVENWDFLYEQIYNNLVEGGLVEIQEFDSAFKADDDTLQHSPSITLWNEKYNEAGRKSNHRLDIVRDQRTFLEKAGFIEIREAVYKVPIGAWAREPRLKQLGQLTLLHGVEHLESFMLAPFVRVLGWSREEVDHLSSEIKKEFSNPKNHLYVSAHFVYGRKP